MRASWYPWVFVGTDFFSIVIQAVGGAVSATATGGSTVNASLLDVGSGLLTAGVAFQAANMIFCGGLMVIYWWRYRKDAGGRAERARMEDARRNSEGTALRSEVGEQVNAHDQSGSEITPDSSEPTKKTPQYNMGPPPKAGDLKKFIWALLIAYLAVLIRCIYRYVFNNLYFALTRRFTNAILVYQKWRQDGVAISCRTKRLSSFLTEGES
jgi:hypothetical protein